MGIEVYLINGEESEYIFKLSSYPFVSLGLEYQKYALGEDGESFSTALLLEILNWLESVVKVLMTYAPEVYKKKYEHRANPIEQMREELKDDIKSINKAILKARTLKDPFIKMY